MTGSFWDMQVRSYTLALGIPEGSLSLAVINLSFSSKDLPTLHAFHGPVAEAADPGNVSEMQNLRPHSDPLNQSLHFPKSPSPCIKK